MFNNPGKAGLTTFCFAFTLFCMAASASVVRMEIQIGNEPVREVFLELYDTPGPDGRTAAPNTVANFLDYIEDSSGLRRYDNSFLHRSVPGFIIQGGGFVYDPDLGDFSPTSVSAIPAIKNIDNEFDASRSNVRGTISMAKQGGDPNSANSQWFINLADNNPSPDQINLDTDNGGFTVFGQVLGDGMAVMDAIAALELRNLGRPFDELPVTNNSLGNPVTGSNIVYLRRVETNPSARLYISPDPLDFDLTVPGDPAVQKVLTLQNIGGAPLTINSIATQATLDVPFSLVNNNCTGASATLAPLATCTLDISFEPGGFGAAQDSIDISSSDTSQPGIIVNVLGFGAAATPTLEVVAGTSASFGNIALLDSAEQTIVIRNIGVGDLQPDSVTLSSASGTDFSIVSDACVDQDNPVQLSLSQSCAVTIRLTGNTLGAKTDTLTISASGQTAQVALSGTVSVSRADLVLPDNSTIDVGDTRSDLTLSLDYTFTNQGSEDLIIDGMVISGPDASQFNITTKNCFRLSPGFTCQETFEFTPSGLGSRTATLEISSNDPDSTNGVTLITLTATSSTDDDGVPDAIEAAGLNDGDGNQDGIADAQQENVTSLPSVDSGYITLVADAGLVLTRVRTLDNPSPETTPASPGSSVSFPVGFLGFRVEGLEVGGSTSVTLHLPPGEKASNYFKYTRNGGWYLFDFEEATQTGAEFQGDRIILHFVDGGRGDNDRTANGTIIDPGGPAVIGFNGSSGGGGGCTMTKNGIRESGDWWFLMLALVLMRYRKLRAGRTAFVPVSADS